MKTFISDDYQVTLKDNGSFEVRIIEYFRNDTIIIRYDSYNKTWTIPKKIKNSSNITDLQLSKSKLETLHEALEVIDKQDLMDNEIVFVDKIKEKTKWI